jgi:hypothetical protein
MLETVVRSKPLVIGDIVLGTDGLLTKKVPFRNLL